MRSIVRKSLFIFLILFLLVGCSDISDQLSQEQAKSLVLENHQRDIGSPEIISIEIKWNAYYVEWENKENKEWGIDKVTKEGDVEMVEATIE
jgi:uncharacterized protein YcfL